MNLDWEPAMASSPTAWSWLSSPRNGNEPAVYVIEAGRRSFAFEAGSRAQAEDLVRSHWFRQAFDRFCSERFGTRSSSDRPRVATAQEAAAFRDVAAEFADATGDFLVAHLD
jgi:hypothetical protein